MRPIAVPAALARLAASLLACLMLTAPAAAADRALLDMLGYSEDGRYFAFEQFGVQDGSGFAFSSVYVVDLARDEWTEGTPFAAIAESEDETLADIRAEAMATAKDQLAAYRIGVPAQVLALIGDGAADDSGARIDWSTPSCCGAGQTQADRFALMLETRGITSSDDYCAQMNPVGFNLYYQDQFGRKSLHEDADTLPKSRGCTLAYRLYAAVQPYEDYYGKGFESRRLAIVATYPFGFEGVDRRFLVVPIDK